MEIGLFAINYGTCADPEAAVRVAQHAEAAGFESVWTGEHLVLPTTPPEGFAIPSTLPFLDTVVALTLAPRTHHHQGGERHHRAAAATRCRWPSSSPASTRSREAA